MKIIDEKGRLFGKINIIDFLAILVLFCIIPIFYFSYKLFLKTTETMRQQKEFIDFETTCNLIKLKPEILKLIKVGDREIDNNKRQIGEIIWIGEDRPYEYKFDIGAEKMHVIKDTALKELSVKLRLTTEIKENSMLYYNNNQIIVNSPFYFKSSKYTVMAIPVGIEKKELVRVKVKFSNIPIELSTLIKTGDTENDSSGKTLSKIIEIISNAPTKTPAIKLDENRIIFLDELYYNDVVVLSDILCHSEDGTLYFKGHIIKAGSDIDFMTDLYIISGKIIDIIK